MKVYVASSSSNPHYLAVIERLRLDFHSVYDFRNPPNGAGSFAWSQIDPAWESWSPSDFRDALDHPRARQHFHSDMGALRSAEACVLPSHQENFGIAVAEALACDLPVLISNKVNIWREIVADGAGLVADDSYEGAAQLLNIWLRLGPEERTAMAARAGRCFRLRYQIDAAAETLLSTLQNEPALA